MKSNKLLGIIFLSQAAIWGTSATLNFSSYARIKEQYAEKPTIQMDNSKRNLGIIDLCIAGLGLITAGAYFGAAGKEKEKQYFSL